MITNRLQGAILTSDDAGLGEALDAVINDDDDQCKAISLYIQFWRDIHVEVPKANRETVNDSFTWGRIFLSQYAWWLFMHREFI